MKRVFVLAIAVVVIVATAIVGYVYLESFFSATNASRPGVTTINIPQGSYIEPSSFNLTKF